MDFDSIVLTKKELRRLEQLSNAPGGLPRAVEDQTLYNRKLIFCEHYRNDNGTGSSLYFISQDGKDYLGQKKRNDRTERKGRQHDWIIAIFSLIAGAILSRPLWETIDLIIEFFKNLP